MEASGEWSTLAGPIEAGSSAQEEVSRYQAMRKSLGMSEVEVLCVASEMYPEVRKRRKGRAQYERVIGSFWALVK